MKSIIPALLTAFLFSFVGAKAQQNHYIYIQTSNKQPFYVKLDKKIYSSTASGYLILSKLVDSTYSIGIGFPKNDWPQQTFNCVVNQKDLGYLLKNFGDKGWGLFNLQTLEVTMSGAPAADKNIVKEERTDSFSNMLSAVVNDPGIKEKRTVKQEVKTEEVIPAENVATQVTSATVSNPAAAKVSGTSIKSTIIKILQRSTSDGTEMVYLDNNNSGQDTIRVFIPADKNAATDQQNAVPQQPIVQPVKEEEKVKQVISPEPALVDTAVKTIEVKPAIPAKSVTAAAPKEINFVEEKNTNSNCKNQASDEDFLKLRKKMAGETSDDKMISAANKVFKTRCFTTAQIQNLSYLFLKDDSKYKFFDMAYPFVSDTQNYGSLQSQLTDAYYVERFKAMIHH